MKLPILITAFNRADEARQVLSAVRAYRPTHLYIALDGPRPDHPGELAKCAEVRRALDAVDWDCRVERLTRSENLGCRMAMEGAIDWFFDSVPEGIILEDDCVPSPDFFRFCEELLERYRFDERVGMVSGTNVLGEWRPERASYLFGSGAVWGWASWRRAWLGSGKHPAVNLPEARLAAERTLGPERWSLLEPCVRAVMAGDLDTWDYPWVFAMAARGQVAVLPAVNLVSNIGFGPDATHTTDRRTPLAQLKVLELEDPLRHPEEVVFDREFDARWQVLDGTGTTKFSRLARWVPPSVQTGVRSLLRLGRAPSNCWL